MISNYLKIALRNLLRYKGYTLISVCGLALGLTCCMALFLYIQHELNYDTYHSKKDRIYRLTTEVVGSSYGGIAKVHGPWGPAAKGELPEVENMARFVFARQTLFSKEDVRIYENDGLITDSTVFDLFDFKIINGNSKNALSRPDGIVLTQSLAKKYFGDQNPLGKELTLNNEQDVVVTSVIEDVPSNSHFTFTFLLPMTGYHHPQKESWIEWNQFYTYLLLKEGASPMVVSNKFKDLLPSHLDAQNAALYIPLLQPLLSIHLHSNLFREMEANSDILYLYIFGAVGLLILVISAINFINLSTARALTRMKEVGIRKASGALRKQLIAQYLSESLLISFTSMAVGIILLILFLPSFNTLVNKSFTTASIDLNFIGYVMVLTTIVGLIAGGYPAFFLANQKPSEILKGKSKNTGSSKTRKILVVTQFSISAFLAISVFIVYKQLSFIQSKKLGFNPSELITIPIQENELRIKSESIKRELLANSSIESVSVSGGQPGGNDWGIPLVIEGMEPDQIPPIRVLAVDQDFIKTFQMEMKDGRDFTNTYSDSLTYVVNEEAVKQLGWSDPLSQRISMPAINRPSGAVVGVIKDFHFRSLKEKIGPVVLFIPPISWSSYYTIRINSSQMDEGLATIKNTWSKFDPAHPLTYTFFDQTYGELYSAEKRLGKLIAYFTAIGIFIASLGLFSLAAFVTEQRTKEIGIRKVMGASVQSITLMLTKDFIALVIVGFIIAAPVGYYIMGEWLSDFAYRINITAGIFVMTARGTMLIALIAVGYKVVSAGMSNPIESLRVE